MNNCNFLPEYDVGNSGNIILKIKSNLETLLDWFECDEEMKTVADVKGSIYKLWTNVVDYSVS